MFWLAQISFVEKVDCLNQIWRWRSRSIATQNNTDLHQAIFNSGPNLVILACMGISYGPDKLKMGKFWLLS